MEALHNLTPLVEQISIDEAFLDVSILPEDAETLARRLQAQIRDGLGLPCSLGVATNKLVAKIANNIGKSRVKGGGSPNAITVVPPGGEAAFLAPLDATELWGVGPKTAERLAGLGMRTNGDIARLPEEDLRRRFGKNGADLARRARGIDDGQVETERETKSVSHEVTFARDVSDEDVLKRTLREQADGVGRRLRKAGLAGTTIHIKLRWSDFTTLTRQATRPQPTDLDDEIYETALRLFEKNWPPGRAVRLIGVGASGFETPARQLSLWDAGEDQAARSLQSALDDLREKFGDDAIRRGSDMEEE
jgi:nucleotidyltransferase/DNA polymerase involved in DNA repair